MQSVTVMMWREIGRGYDWKRSREFPSNVDRLYPNSAPYLVMLAHTAHLTGFAGRGEDPWWGMGWGRYCFKKKNGKEALNYPVTLTCCSRILLGVLSRWHVVSFE